MATLRHLASGADHPLSPRHLLGRAPACQLQIDDPEISGFHAELIWDGDRWSVQDLGSRNGTRLAGRALARGEQVPLPRDAELILAGSVRFRLIDDSPPELLAQCEDGQLRRAERELLCLPSDDAPELTLFRELDGSWWVESATQTRALGELETLVAGGKAWRVSSPKLLPRTHEAGGRLLGQHELRFRVSRDGEHVELELVGDLGSASLEPRAHLSLLLALARARLRDSQLEQLPAVEHGWVYRDDLPRMLGIQPDLVNLWIHRARQQLARAGIRDAAAVVERRAGAKQLRIGAARLRIDDA